MIISRENERKLLVRSFSSDRPEFIAVYGRRRIGKTFLVRAVSAKTSATVIEVVGMKSGDKAQQLQIFRQAVQDKFYGGAELAPFSSWDGAFQFLTRAIDPLVSKRKKIILFLDELPWLATPRAGLLEALDHYWNAYWSKMPTFKLIVCGSAASWILKHIVNSKGGLHNRITERLLLEPLSLSESATYLKAKGIELPPHLLAELYFCLGGVPFYLDDVKPGESPAQSISRMCFSKNGLLRDEYDRLFSSLFDDAAVHYKIVAEVADHYYGCTRKGLMQALGASSGGSFDGYLSELCHAGFLDGIVPFGAGMRERRYRLIDEYVFFYHSWMTKLGRGSLQRVPFGIWNKIRSGRAFPGWRGYAFENTCLKHVDTILDVLGLQTIAAAVSTWGSKEAQVDMVIDRDDGLIHLCEVKFTEAPDEITKQYAAQLDRKREAFMAAFGKKKQCVFTFITSHGIKKTFLAGKYVHSEITVADLVRSTAMY